MEIKTHNIGQTIWPIFRKIVYKGCPNCGGDAREDWMCSICDGLGEIEDGVRFFLGKPFMILKITITIIGNVDILYWDTDLTMPFKKAYGHVWPGDQVFESQRDAELTIETLNKEIDT